MRLCSGQVLGTRSSATIAIRSFMHFRAYSRWVVADVLKLSLNTRLYGEMGCDVVCVLVRPLLETLTCNHVRRSRLSDQILRNERTSVNDHEHSSVRFMHFRADEPRTQDTAQAGSLCMPGLRYVHFCLLVCLTDEISHPLLNGKETRVCRRVFLRMRSG